MNLGCKNVFVIQQVMQDITQLKASVSVMQTDLMDQQQRIKSEAIRPIVHYLECKICKDIPTPPVVLLLCCSQILGCEACLENCMGANDSCPLCRTANPTTVQIHGQDGMYSLLREQSSATISS